MRKKANNNKIIWFIFFLFILPLGTVMAFFDSMKVHLFSEMQGVVTLNGNPVEGAVITRSAISNNDKEVKDSTSTDSAGRFRFGKMQTSMFLKLLPTQIVVDQKMIIEYQGKQYLACKAEIVGDSDKGELNEQDVIDTDKEMAIDLRCELSARETDKAGAYTTVISGICNWDGQKILD